MGWHEEEDASFDLSTYEAFKNFTSLWSRMFYLSKYRWLNKLYWLNRFLLTSLNTLFSSNALSLDKHYSFADKSVELDSDGSHRENRVRGITL